MTTNQLSFRFRSIMDQLKGLEKDSEEYINALQKLLRNTKDRNKRKTEKLKRTSADGYVLSILLRCLSIINN